MGTLYVNNGSFTPVKYVWVNNGGSWTKLKVEYVNDGGTWKQVYPGFTPGSIISYTSPTTSSFIVPTGASTMDFL